MDPAKVAAIRNWQAPTSVKGVRGFLGFANYYRTFLDRFSDLTAPWNALIRKSAPKPFRWTPEANKAFETLKELFITEPILAQFDCEKDTVLEADSSGYASGGVLSQFQSDGLLRPSAFFSKKNSPAESNYVIRDKELLAIIRCLKEWDTELRLLRSPFVIYTDHQNLQYFTKVQRLNERQIRWADIFSKFNYQLRYRPSSKQGKSDVLSRRDQDQDQPDSETGEKRLYQLFKPHVLPKPGSLIFVSVTVTEYNKVVEKPLMGCRIFYY